MTLALGKRVKSLEAEFWAKAESIKPSYQNGLLRFRELADPIDGVIFGRWLVANDDMGRRLDRANGVKDSLPPVHPSFLPGKREALRRHQWAYHNSREFCELSQTVFDLFLAYVRATFDMTGGLLKLALQVFKADIDQWQAEREYFGHPASREDLAQETVSVWRCFSRLAKESVPEYNESLREPLWRQAGIEATRELYCREMTAADYDLDAKMWEQLRKDMAVGLPASESEAARYWRDLFERYPRKAIGSQP
ncbi:MAG TPA: hypothetical protein VJ464_25885 [Blastocatellia bacterium]|nr:hypothetical protein [Blastocatellia bacterium]